MRIAFRVPRSHLLNCGLFSLPNFLIDFPRERHPPRRKCVNVNVAPPKVATLQFDELASKERTASEMGATLRNHLEMY
jgi:hypothetical protein